MVGRNSDLVLQSRFNGYTPYILDKLLYTDRSLIDGWDKMMSIYQSKEWPHFSRIRNSMIAEIKKTLVYRNSLDSLQFENEVVETLKTKGPLQSTRLDLGKSGTGDWGHRNVSGVIMDYMFNIGRLGIYKKKNTQKIYDLIENLLSNKILQSTDPFDTDIEFYKWYVLRRIGSSGLIWDKSGGAWLGFFISNKKLRLKVLSELVDDGSIKQVQVEGIQHSFYIRTSDLIILEQSKIIPKKEIKFLAPLDNLLWDRDLIEQLFGFKYRWEVYTPIKKREYGYYVLPVLYGNDLIARVEMNQQRDQDPLCVKNWWWEKDIKQTKSLEKEIIKGLNEFCHYLGANGLAKDSTKKIFG